MLAVMAMALLPTVSHALNFAHGGHRAWAEVCTPQGMKLVAVDSAPGTTGEPNSPASAAGHLEHCPYCAGAGTVAGLPPVPTRMPDFEGVNLLVPRLFLQAPHSSFAWCSAQPRAPPTRA